MTFDPINNKLNNLTELYVFVELALCNELNVVIYAKMRLVQQLNKIVLQSKLIDLLFEILLSQNSQLITVRQLTQIINIK